MVFMNLCAISMFYSFTLSAMCCADVKNEEIAGKIARLETALLDVVRENLELKVELREVNRKVSILQGYLKDTMKSTNNKLVALSKSCACDEYTDLKVRQRRIIPPSTPTSATMLTQNLFNVAFFAATSDHQEHLGVHQPIGFPKIITNDGSGWDAIASLFRAPVKGLYYFTANIMTHYNEDIETELVKNGNKLIVSYDGNGATHAMSTLSAVLHLDIDDEVWIRISANLPVNNGNVRVYGNQGSWFCGFQISK